MNTASIRQAPGVYSLSMTGEPVGISIKDKNIKRQKGNVSIKFDFDCGGDSWMDVTAKVNCKTNKMSGIDDYPKNLCLTDQQYKQVINYICSK